MAQVNPVPVVFIDDSPFERRIFKEAYAGTPGWDVIIAETYAQATELLSGRSPILWLLDLWGNDPEGDSTPELPAQADLAAEATRIPGLDAVYAGLDSFPGDKPNEFLKRLYTIVNGWSTLFLKTAAAADQTRAYGLYNLAQIRRDHPGAIAVAYTRKSQSIDLVTFMSAGGDGAFLKPHAGSDEAILARTLQEAPDLIGRLGRLVNQRTAANLMLWSLENEGPQAAYLYSLAAALTGRTRPPGDPVVHFDDYTASFIATVRDWLALRV